MCSSSWAAQEICIRTIATSLSRQLDVRSRKPFGKGVSRALKRSRKRIVRYGLLSANIIVLIGVVFFVINSQSSGEAVQGMLKTSAKDESMAGPLDQLSSADIAVNVAHLTGLPESKSVENHADTFNTQLTTATSGDSTIVAKPQIVTAGLKSKKDITSYVTKQGDTITSIAQAFSVSTDSIKWSNALTADSIAAGRKLVIPPSGMNGIVYTVKAGDTVDSLAQKYSADKVQIAEFNDAELAGIKQGEQIFIPNGVQPVTRTSSYSASFAWGGYTAVYSSNGYDYGWCTWWSAKRRQDIGRPIPSNLGNAITWATLAQRAGYSVNGVPASGDVAYYRTIGGLGHVGFVEQVNDDGSIWISDMNYFGVSQIGGSTPAGGWGRTSYHLVPESGLGAYLFIH